MADLNPQQQAAARHVEGPLLVLAGAGSGKTRVITHRIAHLIDLGILPSDILAVTFTNKAAEEMRSRIRLMKNAQVLASTFHSLGARILRESIGTLGYKIDFTIYDEEDSEKILKNCLEQHQIPKESFKEIRLNISSAKNNLQSPEAFQHSVLGKVYSSYQTALKDCNAVDFDDLLYLTAILLQQHEQVRREYQNRWLFVLIDEYQDTNFAQYTLAKILVEKHRNLFVVGDPDQSIYSWRGARYENILNFEKDFPGATVITLDQNYRSTNTILSASNALITHNQNRYEKKLWSAGVEGEKIGVFIAPTERLEAEFAANRILKHITEQRLSLDDIAIFYRTNAQSRPFEDALLAKRINYTIVGGLSFYARREIKDILAYLKLLTSNTDLVSFLRTINLPKRGLGPAALEKLVDYAAKKNQPILSFCEEFLQHPGIAPDLKLNTKQRIGLENYLHILQRLRDVRPSLKIHELIVETVTQSNYLNYLKEDPETEQDRKENLDELIGKASEWAEEREHPTLQSFLEELTLRSTTEEKKLLPSVKLMTLHNSKGLEYSLVFLAGLEEDLCPHINAKDDSIEEERRLCYVGMTRAKELLYLTASSYRFMWGTLRSMKPSRFFREIPVEFLRNFSPVSPAPEVEEFGGEPEGFSPGEKIIHQQFGIGTILKSFHGSLGTTYEVLFESGTSRTLVAKFAKLQRIES